MLWCIIVIGTVLGIVKAGPEIDFTGQQPPPIQEAVVFQPNIGEYSVTKSHELYPVDPFKIDKNKETVEQPKESE